jgi:hypothetical protein
MVNKDVASRSKCIMSVTGCLMNNELERMWREVVMAKHKVLSGNLPGGTEENHENHCHHKK